MKQASVKDRLKSALEANKNLIEELKDRKEKIEKLKESLAIILDDCNYAGRSEDNVELIIPIELYEMAEQALKGGE